MEDQYNRVVPKHASNYIYCFGGVAFVLFVILAVTGIMLAVYYRPNTRPPPTRACWASPRTSEYGW